MTQTNRVIINNPSGAYFSIQDLPVKSVQAGIGLGIGSLNLMSAWDRHLCSEILRHWKSIGSVAIYDKEWQVITAEEAFRLTAEKAEKIINSLIANKVFREEGNWLIPLKPLLSCATPNSVKVNFPWCLVKTYSDTEIMLKTARYSESR